MYFVDEAHQNNYFTLMELYHLSPGKNGEYESNIYLAAYPQIYKAYNEDLLIEQIRSERISPLYYMLNEEYNDGHRRGALTSTTAALCEAGLSLYNGYPVGLNDLFGTFAGSKEGLSLFLEACDIRMNGGLLNALSLNTEKI